jgi:cation diffusion facilitator CzcD-associated flavoprotein CzcO
LPDYPGIQEFEGHLRHSSNWDPSFDPTGKTIAVIGNGASGIQVTTPLQKVAKHLDHYARSPTWIAPSFGQEKRSETPVYFSEERKKSFEDPKTYYNFRKPLESQFWCNFHRIFNGSKGNNEAKVAFKQSMTTQLEKKPEILAAILPDFEPFCRRPTPGPGYLAAISADNVSYITTPIERFTKTGIVTVDGVERSVDAVICATGANRDWAPPFPIIANGIDLHEAWQPDGKYKSPYAYFGIAPPLFPNLLFSTGPNSFGLSGTYPFTLETVATYIAKVLRKIQTQGIKTIVVSESAAADFIEYVDKFFEKTVLSGNCSSWYNGEALNFTVYILLSLMHCP